MKRLAILVPTVVNFAIIGRAAPAGTNGRRAAPGEFVVVRWLADSARYYIVISSVPSSCPFITIS